MLLVEQHIKLNYLKFYCVMLTWIKCVEWIISLRESVRSSRKGNKKQQAKMLIGIAQAYSEFINFL